MINATIPQVPVYLLQWYEQLTSIDFIQAIPEPSRAGIFAVNMVNGYINRGNMASDRFGRLVPPVLDIFQHAYDYGVRNFVILRDLHTEDALEFNTFPLHCTRNTPECEIIPELQTLPFAGSFSIIDKNSLNPSMGTVFERWLVEHEQINRAVVVGVCTDLCVYQLAMYLRLRANTLGYRDYHVIVPSNAVETYDLSLLDALESDAMVHDGNYFQRLFLYHMALNGIRVVKEIM